MIFLVENSESNEKCEKTLEIIYISSTRGRFNFWGIFLPDLFCDVLHNLCHL